MSADRSDLPFLSTYLLVMRDQASLFLRAGMLFGLTTAVLGCPLAYQGLVGLAWGILMWLSAGNFFAIGFAWRRSAILPITGEALLRAAIDHACEKRRLVVLTESPNQIVLSPRKLRLHCQLSYIEIEGKNARLTAPALLFWDLKKDLERALDSVGTASV